VSSEQPNAAGSPLEEILEQIRHHPRLIVADDYELALQRVRTQTARFANGDPSHSGRSEGLWISLRILHRKRPGRAVTTARTREALGLLVENAFESARLSSPDPWFRFPIWKNIRSERPSAAPITYDSLHGSLRAPCDLFEESYEISFVETSLRRKSERFGLAFAKEIHSAAFSLLSRGEDDFTLIKQEHAAMRPLRERADWVESLGNLSHRLRQSRPIGTGRSSSVIFSAPVVAALLRRLEPFFFADDAQSGRSTMPVEIGQPLFAPCITLADHGQFPEAPQSAPFDMEGTPTQETVLVDRGCLRDRLYDAYAATKENRLSTGNFLRGLRAAHPRIGASNLYVRPAAASLGELVHAMREGWVVEVIDSLEPSALEDHRFRLRGRGWRVAEGRCVEPVRNLFYQFDIFDLFRRAVAVGDDLQFFGPFGSPSIFFEEIPLSK
jgi:predicted Zn-dependent protease